MRPILALASFLLLAGCAAQGPSQADVNASIRKDAQIGKELCARRFPISPRTNHVAQARCLNEYDVAVIRPQSRHPDLNAVVNARRLATAEKADSGAITEAEAAAQLAELYAYAIGEYDRRENSSTQTQAQIATARAAQSQAISAASSASPVQPQPARGCWRENNIMVCH